MLKTSVFEEYEHYLGYLKAKGEIFEEIPEEGESQSENAEGQRKRWMVTTYPAILQALDDPALSSDRSKIFKLDDPALSSDRSKIEEIKSILSNTLITRDGGDHTELRERYVKAFNSCFTRDYNLGLRTLLAQEAERLIQQQDEIDILKEFARPLVSYLNLKLLGVNECQKQQFEEGLKKVALMLPGNSFVKENLDQGVEGALKLKKIFKEAIKEHQKGKIRNDLLGSFLESMEGLEQSKLIDRSLGLCFLLVSATEGVVNLIGNGTLALLLYPLELQKLKKDPQLISSAVNELLRFIPPVEHLLRVAKHPTRIAGRKIEEGDVVILNLGVANHYNDHIPFPDQLNIERKYHLVFGYGLHECLGQNLARLVGEVTINSLLGKGDSLELNIGPNKRSQWLQSPRQHNGLRGLNSLPVKFVSKDSTNTTWIDPAWT
jgi:pimeloyl-[acyl-carrier protein] synthase